MTEFILHTLSTGVDVLVGLMAFAVLEAWLIGDDDDDYRGF